MARRPKMLRRQGYHHGNLREALVLAARELIAERGPAGFTLVEAARRAGVSPAAPYRHFKDREALVVEVRRRGFEEFGRRLGAAWVDAEADPVGAFSRMGAAYLAFAREEPGYYSAMFTPGPANVAGTSSKAADATFEALESAIARLAGRTPQNRNALALLAYQVWAFTHGVATLSAAGYLAPRRARPTPEAVLQGVAALIEGTMRKRQPGGSGQPVSPADAEQS